MITEREHWLSITDDPNWKRNHIADPNISLDETVDAIVSTLPRRALDVFEIGCGYGRLMAELHRRNPALRITGIDVNAHVLQEACRYGKVFCQDDLDGLSEQDLIYSVAVFQHLPDMQKRSYIHQAVELLKPRGVLRIQFIEGDRDNFCDHWTPAEQMLMWCHDAGYTKTTVTRGLVHPQWSWITAVKR